MKSTLSSYLGHLGGYVVAAATIVSSLDPKLIPPQYSFFTALSGLVVIASHHAYTAGNVNGTVTAAANAAAKAIAGAAPALLFVALASLGLAACKTLPTPNEQAGITVAVDIATGAAIQNGGGSSTSWATRAKSFKAIAVEVKATNDAGTATLATLAADLAPLIAKLPPADQLAAHTLVAALTPFLNQEIQSNPQLQNTQATLDLILQAVIDSCSAYGA